MGGSDTDILAQFLAEALCNPWPAAFWALWWASPWSNRFVVAGHGHFLPLLVASSLGSIVFSALIGVAGGLYPALQASRMDVVTALRFE